VSVGTRRAHLVVSGIGSAFEGNMGEFLFENSSEPFVEFLLAPKISARRGGGQTVPIHFFFGWDRG
jgi:hypothetical protein